MEKRGEVRYIDTSHSVRLYRNRLPTLGCRRRKRVPTIVEPYIERPPTIHILLELSYTTKIMYVRCGEMGTDKAGDVPMAVSASGTCANCTTPAPLERVPSNKISASSTWPVVSNNSTRSSFAVDHGSYSSCTSRSPTIASIDLRSDRTHVTNHDLLARLCFVSPRTIIATVSCCSCKSWFVSPDVPSRLLVWARIVLV